MSPFYHQLQTGEFNSAAFPERAHTKIVKQVTGDFKINTGIYNFMVGQQCHPKKQNILASKSRHLVNYVS